MRKLDFIENETLRRDLPPFKVGDTVAVHVRVREGDKERIQVFQGLVIRRRGGGIGETFLETAADILRVALDQGDGNDGHRALPLRLFLLVR